MANRRPGVARRAKSWLAARIVESGGSRASLVHPEVDLLPLPGLGSALSELRTPAAVELDKLASLWVNVGPRSPCVQYRIVTMGDIGLRTILGSYRYIYVQKVAWGEGPEAQ